MLKFGKEEQNVETHKKKTGLLWGPLKLQGKLLSKIKEAVGKKDVD